MTCIVLFLSLATLVGCGSTMDPLDDNPFDGGADEAGPEECPAPSKSFTAEGWEGQEFPVLMVGADDGPGALELSTDCLALPFYGMYTDDPDGGQRVAIISMTILDAGGQDWLREVDEPWMSARVDDRDLGSFWPTGSGCNEWGCGATWEMDVEEFDITLDFGDMHVVEVALEAFEDPDAMAGLDDLWDDREDHLVLYVYAHLETGAAAGVISELVVTPPE